VRNGLQSLNKVQAIVSYYDYPNDSRLISDDKTKMLLFGSIESYKYTNDEINNAIQSSLKSAGSIPFRASLGTFFSLL